MEFTVKIANVTVSITCMFEAVFTLCREYIVEDEPDFRIEIQPEDIAFEREKARREAIIENKPYYDFSDPYLETLAVYRKIATAFPHYGAMLIHGAVVGLHGKAYLFTAPSGVGKTTHTGFWLKQFPDAFIINGDKPILRMEKDGVFACGTPWAGKEGRNTNTMLPLAAVCVLTRGEKNSIEPVPFGSIYPLIIQQVYRPATAAETAETMNLIKQLGERVNFYTMTCNLDPGAAKVAFEGMNG